MDKKELEVIEEKANNITDKYLLHNNKTLFNLTYTFCNR